MTDRASDITMQAGIRQMLPDTEPAFSPSESFNPQQLNNKTADGTI